MSERVDRLAAGLGDTGVDVMLVTDLVNVRYLTDYYGTNGLALVGRLGVDTRAFITDFRYTEQAAEQVESSFERSEAPLELFDAITEVLPGGDLRLGFEDAHLTVRQHDRLRKLLPERVSLVGVEGAVERLREVKHPDEVERIRAATQLADAAFAKVVADGLIGRTEAEVALALEVEMRRLGARKPSFETIIAAGSYGALPHAMPRDDTIVPGQLVVIDWGAELDGYCSDCTRTLAAGAVDGEASDVYELVLRAQLVGLGAVRAGARCREVDSAARQVIEAAGHGEHFGHGLGHGVGLEVHEGPRLSQRADESAELEAGNVVTVEPGVYVPGAFGVRIEDLVVVEDEERCEVLTSVPKELTVVG
jgi:Xaa-Pro aminopeptidase